MRRFVSVISAVLLVSMIGAPPSAAAADAAPLTDAQVQAAVTYLDTLVPEYLERSQVPGAAVAVVYKGKILYAKGFGTRDVETGAPVTADTVFQIASMSKPISASVVAAAVGNGIVSWDDPVKKYLKTFAVKDPYVTSHATIGDMFAMRSGLPTQAGDMLEVVGFTWPQILARLRFLPLDPFRITYAYTNFGLTTGAQAVASAAHTSWGSLAAKLLYEPLGMTSTSSTHAGFLARANRAELHVKVDGAYASAYTRQPDAQSPAGGVSSNVRDLATWMNVVLANGMHDGKQVLSAEALATANTPQIRRSPVGDPAGASSFYGYGMVVDVDATGRVRLGHSGAFSAGAGTNATMLPGSQLGIVTLTNAIAGVAESISTGFIDYAEHGALTNDWYGLYGSMFASMLAEDPGFALPQSPVAARPKAQLIGRYANDFYGTVRIVDRSGQLTLVIGPKQLALPLTHWSGDRYVAVLSEQTPPTKVWVAFEGPSGPAAKLMIGFSDDPTNTLRRVAKG